MEIARHFRVFQGVLEMFLKDLRGSAGFQVNFRGVSDGFQKRFKAHVRGQEWFPEVLQGFIECQMN